MKESAIEYLKASELRPYPRNARTHSRKQIRQIADSIRQFGFTNPLLIDSQNVILAGHGRLAAAKSIGLEQIPCVRLEGMTAQQKRAYVLADNKLALNAGWDEELLALELQNLMELDLDFDIGITGFSIAEIDGLMGGLSPQDAGDPEDDRIPADNGEPPVTRLGDIWELGPHRLICGDSLLVSTVEALMGGEKAEMVFTDPPYNVPIDGHVGGPSVTVAMAA